MKNTIIAQDRKDLKSLIKKEIKLNGLMCDLNHLDVSLVTNMSHLFQNSEFNGNISDWNVSRVTTMRDMFYSSHFNGDISKWNTSRVKSMNRMFTESRFNGDISRWDVSRVIEMNYMFGQTDGFNQDLSAWEPFSLKSKTDMFFDCSAPRPYWYSASDTQEALKKIQLKYDLDAQLVTKDESGIKVKI